MGEFFDPSTEAAPHVCSLPEPVPAPGHGGWRCDCGLAYVLSRPAACMVKPGVPRPWRWWRAPQHDIPSVGELVSQARLAELEAGLSATGEGDHP